MVVLQSERKSSKVEEIKLQKEDVVPIEQNYTNLEPHLKQAEVVYSVRHAVDGICRHFGRHRRFNLGIFRNFFENFWEIFWEIFRNLKKSIKNIIFRTLIK